MLLRSLGVAVLIESSFALSPFYRCALFALVWYLTVEKHIRILIFKMWIVDTQICVSLSLSLYPRLNYNIDYTPNTKMYDNQIIKLSSSMLGIYIQLINTHKTLNALNIIWYEYNNDMQYFFLYHLFLRRKMLGRRFKLLLLRLLYHLHCIQCLILVDEITKILNRRLVVASLTTKNLKFNSFDKIRYQWPLVQYHTILEIACRLYE